MIDYSKISQAIQMYKSFGYEYIELPWLVSKEDVMITAPDEYHTEKLSDTEYLLGSAEQAFLSLDRRKLLSPAKYVACSPCFRKENVYDDLHKRHFLKVELYQNYDAIYRNSLHEMMDQAINVFTVLSGATFPFVKEEMSDGSFDINYNGIEIGSYGIRHHYDYDLHWVYGAGLAELDLVQ